VLPVKIGRQMTGAAGTCHSPSVDASDRCTSEPVSHSRSSRRHDLAQTQWQVSGSFLGTWTGTADPEPSSDFPESWHCGERSLSCVPQNRFGSKPTRADSSEEGVRRVYLTPRGWRR